MSNKLRINPTSTQYISSKSLENCDLIQDEYDRCRFKHIIQYYSFNHQAKKFSDFIKTYGHDSKRIDDALMALVQQSDQSNQLVEIIDWNITSSEVFLVLKQNQDNGISKFMGNLLNSYSRYYNIKYKRVGPLWSGRFKNKTIKFAQNAQRIEIKQIKNQKIEGAK